MAQLWGEIRNWENSKIWKEFLELAL